MTMNEAIDEKEWMLCKLDALQGDRLKTVQSQEAEEKEYII